MMSAKMKSARTSIHRILKAASLSGVIVLCLTVVNLGGPASAMVPSGVPTGVSLSAPASATAGATITVSGRLWNHAQYLSEEHLVVQYGVPGGSYRALEQVTTNTTGSYFASIKVSATIYLRVIWPGNDANTRSVSPARLISVTSAQSTATSVWVGGCYYTASNGRWYGNYCLQRVVDSTVYELFHYVQSGNHLGTMFEQFDTAYPGYLTWRNLNDSLFKTVLWARVPTSNLDAPVQYEINLGNGWAWYTTAGLQQLVARLQQELAARSASNSNTVTVGGEPESAKQAFGQLTQANGGYDALGGSQELEQVFSNVYSYGIDDPVDYSPCGEVGYVCYPD